MQKSTIKADSIRLLNDQVVMSDGALTGNVTFPAGHVINYNSTTLASQIGISTTQTGVGTGLSVSFTPKYANSKIFITTPKLRVRVLRTLEI